METQGAPAGWYPTREGQRYWDGRQWTEQLAPPAAGVVVVGRDPYETNHVLHLLLTVFTFGLWAPVWLVVAVVNSGKRAKRQAAR